MVKRVRTVFRWLNALSVEANILQIQALEKLEFIQKIDIVASFRRTEPLSPHTRYLVPKKSVLKIAYGPSFAQLDQINVIPLHQLGFSGNDVLVCMMDTGFRKRHEIFQHANKEPLLPNILKLS